MKIVVSRYQYRGGHQRTASFLRDLDIPFRVVKGEDFWKANREQLPELYELMREEARERMAQLHPDRGGDAEQFKDFVADLRRAQKNFGWNLPGQKANSFEGLSIPPGVKFRDPKKAFEVARLFLSGAGAREINRRTRYSYGLIARVRRLMLAGHDLRCYCGRPNGHRGTCASQLSREARQKWWSTPEGLETRQRIIANSKGRKFSELHRSRLSAAGRKRKLSEKERERLRTWRIGTHLSQEQKDHLRKLWLGRGKGIPRSPEVRARISTGVRAALLRHKHFQELLAA